MELLILLPMVIIKLLLDARKRREADAYARAVLNARRDEK